VGGRFAYLTLGIISVFRQFEDSLSSSSTPNALNHIVVLISQRQIAANMEAVQRTTVDSLLGKRFSFVLRRVDTAFTSRFLS
jgi:hypothetical protein